VAVRRRYGAVQPGADADYPLPLPGNRDSHPVGEHDLTHRDLTGLVERPVPGDGHAGCGRRSGKTHWWQHEQGVPGRPHNLVADPSFLLVAWDRVRGNKGARTAGVDGHTVSSIQVGQGVGEFLDGLRSQLKDRSFQPLPVRERMIPKAGGKLRRLGIATITDRVVQASLKLVLEPIFEVDFYPCSYGFRRVSWKGSGSDVEDR
jgi:hypothetical protein